MPPVARQYVLHKYLPDGDVEIDVTAKRTDDYEIDSVYFSVQHGNVRITEEITFYILATRIYGHEYIDDWVAELLPLAMAEADNEDWQRQANEYEAIRMK